MLTAVRAERIIKMKQYVIINESEDSYKASTEGVSITVSKNFVRFNDNGIKEHPRRIALQELIRVAQIECLAVLNTYF